MDLDNLTKTVIYVPYDPSDVPEKETHYPTLYQDRDIPDGAELRLAAYRAAWDRTLSRIQTIVQSLHRPVVDSVVQEVRNAHKTVLQGMPFPEIPVISISGALIPSPFFTSEVIARLEQDECCVAHIHPSECATVSSAMKALVSGFVDKHVTIPQVKRKPTASLASYDIGILIAWYEAHEMEERPNLIVSLHDFEAVDPFVMQDIWEICSIHASVLPLTFLLALSSPASSYIHVAYPRSTLALLRLRKFEVPGGEKMLEEILERTFFEPQYTPPLVLGPTALEFLGDYFTRWNGSVDSLITALQLVHMRHFTEPLTVLHPDDSTGTLRPHLSREAEAHPFLDALLSRLAAPRASHSVPPDHVEAWKGATLDGLLGGVQEARTAFWERARALRVGWKVGRLVARVVQEVTGAAVGSAGKSMGYGKEGEVEGLVEVMSAYVRGRGGKAFVGGVGKLREDGLRRLTSVLLEFLDEVGEVDALEGMQDFAERADGIEGDEGTGEELAGELGKWLGSFVSQRMVDLGECVLWDLWYTGWRGVPSELMNPNVRASILSGLLHPHSYLPPSFSAASDEREAEEGERDISKLPDTSILFRRYLDSGKLINVWDWYESFATVCETQREKEKTAQSPAKSKKHAAESPSKRRSPAKARGKPSKSASPTKDKGKEKADVEGEDSTERDRDEEVWTRQTHARFIRALHELDYLGLIRHTGRKKDCVMRTVWEGQWDEQ